MIELPQSRKLSRRQMVKVSASMPQLLHALVNAAYDNIIWNTWFTANSEESVVTTRHGHRVVVAVHGGGIFATPARFERTYRANVSTGLRYLDFEV